MVTPDHQKKLTKADSQRFQATFRRVVEAVDAGELVATQADKRRLTEFFELTKANRSFLAVLCSALVAHLADPDLHPGSLQLKWDPSEHQPPGKRLKAYNGRDVSKTIVGEAWRLRVSLGRMGSEPAQNKPFTQIRCIYDALRLAEAEGDVPERSSRLIAILDEVAERGPHRARELLAAYVPLGRELFDEEHRDVPLGARSAEFFDLIDHCRDFIEFNSESGKAGQAFVAACLDFVGAPAVDMGSPVYASRNRVGDVALRNATGGILRPYEVRQKDRQEQNLWVWAGGVLDAGLRLGVYVDLYGGADAVSPAELRDIANSLNIVLRHLRGVEGMIASMADSPLFSVERFIAEFPQRFLDRLAEIGASAELRERWVDQVSGPTCGA